MSITQKINELNSQFKTFPKKLKITTATITCKVPSVIFNIENIGKYMNDFDDVYIDKKYGNRKDKKKKKQDEIGEINFGNILGNEENQDDKNIEEEDKENKQIKYDIEIESENSSKNKSDKKTEELNELKEQLEQKEAEKKKKGRKKKIKEVIKVKTKKEKKKGNNFYNQVSLIFSTARLMGIDENTLSKKDRNKNINVKLFINGSIHMTGCKHFDNITKVLKIIFERIIKVKSYYNKDKKQFELIRFANTYDPKEVKEKKKIYQEKNKKIHQDKFLTKIYEELKLGVVDKLTLDDVKRFKIGMINTNFNIGFKVNREVLCKKMAEAGISVNFESISHASVDSKINIPYLNKKISIFVFESGSITIAGSKSYDQIRYGFNFINKFILENYYNLYVKQITPQILVQIIENMKK